MPNIATVLKEEITRVARKSVRAETTSLKKASAQYRSDIAALKRRLGELERAVRIQAKGRSAGCNAAPADDDGSTAFRFSAPGLAKQRQRLGLSAREVGELLDVSALSVYKWEKGDTRPRSKQLPAIAALRKMGKREALAKLSAG